MNELAPLAADQHLIAKMTPPQMAAVVIGALGPDAAAPMLEQFDEQTLRHFATAMSSLRTVKPDMVNATIRFFAFELDQMDSTVQGGISEARTILEQIVNDATLQRIMDHVDMPGVHNVWEKLSMVDEQALAEFLRREHPQTAAVVLSKLSAEHAARVLSLAEP